MKAKSGWAGIVVGLMALAVLGLSCSKKSTSGGGGGGSTSSTPNITVGDDFFSPKTDSVAVGTMVTWTYNGPSVHTVTSDTGAVKELNSGDLKPANKTYTHTFSTTGDFYYHCIYHGTAGSGGQFGSGMTGVVKVR